MKLYNTEVNYKKDEPLKFRDFVLTFQGVFDVMTEEGLTISLQTNNFLIVDNNEKEQILKIGNGQLPNRPRKILVQDNNFTLWTYEAPNKSILKSGTLIVTKDNN